TTACGAERSIESLQASFGDTCTASKESGASTSDTMDALIDKLQGKWVVVSTLAPNDTRALAERRGVEVWKAGPARRSLIEEYWSEEGRLIGHSTIWLAAPGEFSVVWCDEAGCRQLSRSAEWRGDLFVIEDELAIGEGQLALRETFEFTSPTRFVQRLYSGPSFDGLVLFETIEAAR